MYTSPSSTNYLNVLAKKLLEPVKRGESAFIRWFPGHGKTSILNTIFSDKELLKKYLGDYFKRFIFVKIDGYIFSALDIPNFFIYVQNTLSDSLGQNKNKNSQIIPISPIPLPLILTIKKIIDLCRKAVENGLEIVFVIDAIDEFSDDKLKDIFTGWEYIVESNRERIHSHTNVNRQDIIDDVVTQSGLIQNIISISLPNTEECKYFISYYLKKWNFKISRSEELQILSTCGHDPTLIKEALRIFLNNPERSINLLEYPTLLIKAKNNFNLLSTQEKSAVENRLKSDKISPIQKATAKSLSEANFWENNFRIPPIFERIIIKKEAIKELSYNRKANTLTFGEINLKKKLSRKEYGIILLLYRRKGKLVTRDEIAECIWSNKLLDLYSDWAIDKTISRLRKKMEILSIYYQIKTKKKEGFYLET